MRHIQLYLIICKKLYSGRVTHSLSWQKANSTTEKLFLTFGTVSPCAYTSMPSRAGPWLCGSWFHALPSDIHIAVDWTQFYLDSCPYRLTPSLLQKRVHRIKNLSEKWVLSQFHFASVKSAEIKAIFINSDTLLMSVPLPIAIPHHLHNFQAVPPPFLRMDTLHHRRGRLGGISCGRLVVVSDSFVPAEWMPGILFSTFLC